jgi:hypothetical protein
LIAFDRAKTRRAFEQRAALKVAPQKSERSRELFASRNQSGREDSNLRPLDPQSSALTRLRYAPRQSRGRKVVNLRPNA